MTTCDYCPYFSILDNPVWEDPFGSALCIVQNMILVSLMGTLQRIGPKQKMSETTIIKKGER